MAFRSETCIYSINIYSFFPIPPCCPGHVACILSQLCDSSFTMDEKMQMLNGNNTNRKEDGFCLLLFASLTEYMNMEHIHCFITIFFITIRLWSAHIHRLRCINVSTFSFSANYVQIQAIWRKKTYFQLQKEPVEIIIVI